MKRRRFAVPSLGTVGNLDALMARPEEELKHIYLDKIKLPERQSRKFYDPDKLDDLADSILRYGLKEPVLLRPITDDEYEYEIVVGQRRFLASQIAGFQTIKAIVEELTLNDAVEIRLIENLHRENLNPFEAMHGVLELLALKLETDEDSVIGLFSRYATERRGGTAHRGIEVEPQWKVVAETVRSVLSMEPDSFRTNLLSLRKLPSDIQQALSDGKIAYTKARLLARFPEARRQELLEQYGDSISVNELRTLLKAESQANQPQSASKIATLRSQVSKLKIPDDLPERSIEQIERLIHQIEELL